MRADRLIGILLELDRKRKVTAPELAEKFEVSVRTIYRDMNALFIDFPIRPEAGPEGGYSFMEGYKLPSLPFSKKEVAALTLMGSVTEQKLGLIDAGVFKKAFSKLMSSFPEAYRRESSRSSERILIDIEPWKTPPKTTEVVNQLREAIHKDKLIEFQYDKGKGRREKQKVEPYGLCFRSGFWYLVGFSGKRKAFRLFRTDRFSKLKVTGESFKRDPEFKLEEFWTKELPKEYREKGTEVKIIFDRSVANEVKKTVWGAGSVKKLKDGRLELTFRTFDMPRLISFVLSFGPRAEIIEPENIRSKVRKALREALEKYEPVK